MADVIIAGNKNFDRGKGRHQANSDLKADVASRRRKRQRPHRGGLGKKTVIHGQFGKTNFSAKYRFG
jgi:hypothetical protein